VGELDGVWEVRRVSGALPPMTTVRKRIAGRRGQTLIATRRGPTLLGGVLGVGFEVRGNELHYRPPFNWVVDVLEPDGDGYRGRTTAFGRTIGEFELRRIRVTDLASQLIKHLDEAHAMEQTVEKMLDSMLQSTDDPEIVDRLEHHKLETQHHAATMRRLLEAHDAQPSMVRQAAGILEALMKMPFDMVRGEKSGRNARDGYASEHLEIASYELLKRVAQRVGDEETVRACDEILEQERAMAAFFEANWDRFAELSLREEGILV
jgi:ferritin-like metal-binding protein YciE